MIEAANLKEFGIKLKLPGVEIKGTVKTFENRLAPNI
jgi:hypothetical protein